MKIRSTLFNFENILLIFWVGFLLSINSKISDLYSNNINYLHIIIIFLRILTPVLLFSILIFFLKIKKLNLFILSYLIYGLWQLIIYRPDEKYLIEWMCIVPLGVGKNHLIRSDSLINKKWS